MWREKVVEWLEANKRDQAWLAEEAAVSRGYLNTVMRGHLEPLNGYLLTLELAMGMPRGKLVDARDRERWAATAEGSEA